MNKKNIQVDIFDKKDGKTISVIEPDTGRVVTITTGTDESGNLTVNDIRVRRSFEDHGVKHDFQHTMEFGKAGDMQIFTEYSNSLNLSFITQLSGYKDADNQGVSELSYHDVRKNGDKKSQFSTNIDLNKDNAITTESIDISLLLDEEINYLQNLLNSYRV